MYCFCEGWMGWDGMGRDVMEKYNIEAMVWIFYVFYCEKTIIQF